MAPTPKLIQKITLAADVSSVTFGSGATLSQAYTDLRLLSSARTNRANNGDSVWMHFNGDTAYGNYVNRLIYGTGSSIVSISGYDAIYLTQGACGDSDTASTFGNSDAYIADYTASRAKCVAHSGTSETNAATSYMSIDAGLWTGAAAITSILLKPGNGTLFKAGSTFCLYGISKA